jgi:hypothetical protein
METAQGTGLINNFVANGKDSGTTMQFLEAEDVCVGDKVTVSVDFDEPDFTTPVQQAEFDRTFSGVVQGPLPEYGTVPGSTREMWIGGLIVRNSDDQEMRFTPGQTARNIGPQRGGFFDTYAQGTLRIQLLARETAGSHALRLVQDEAPSQAA